MKYSTIKSNYILDLVYSIFIAVITFFIIFNSKNIEYKNQILIYLIEYSMYLLWLKSLTENFKINILIKKKNIDFIYLINDFSKIKIIILTITFCIFHFITPEKINFIQLKIIVIKTYFYTSNLILFYLSKKTKNYTLMGISFVPMLIIYFINIDSNNDNDHLFFITFSIISNILSYKIFNNLPNKNTFDFDINLN
ncbi:hypothetical protein [Flammeovirga pacifica]|uniref:Uncharacterized protein n=1 Tax=Flammeovirga pacifica TaxID=915059 RepID=A0A1S1Z1H0_FLAPC|nr:hypothetical protein [Flammeovirga pacifica]OHX67116.1 hypothetical protein NH26_12570 [Flammeovirga pacifica]